MFHNEYTYFSVGSSILARKGEEDEQVEVFHFTVLSIYNLLLQVLILLASIFDEV